MNTVSLNPSEVLVGLDRNGTIGMGYLGVAFASMMYGLTCLQTFQYYQSDMVRTDLVFTRYFVFLVWLLDSAHQAIVMHSFYYYLVLNYADPEGLARTAWSIPASIIITAALAALVKGFFLLRIWRFTRNVYLTSALGILAVVRIGFNLVYPSQMFSYPLLMVAEEQLKPQILVSSSLDVASDAFFTAVLVYYLWRGRTGIPRSDNIIARLIGVSITTTMVSTLIKVGALASYLAASDKLYVLFFNFLEAPVDANAALTALHSRGFVKRGMTENPNSATVELNQLSAPAFRIMASGATLSVPPVSANGDNESMAGTSMSDSDSKWHGDSQIDEPKSERFVAI